MKIIATHGELFLFSFSYLDRQYCLHHEVTVSRSASALDILSE